MSSDAFIRAVRRRLHPDLDIPSPERSPSPAPAPGPRRRKAAPKPPAADSSASRPPLQPAPANSAAITLSDSGPPSLSQRTTSERTTESGRSGKKSTGASSARGARYRSHPSRPVLDRLARSQRHRLFLIERSDAETEPDSDGSRYLTEKFAVMGANGNVYDCVVAAQPTCTCPDFVSRNVSPCKHLIFVFLRVLKIGQDNPLWWQARLLPAEVHTALSNRAGVHTDGIMADDSVRSMYRATQVGSQRQAEREKDNGRRKPIEGDCPICFEDLAAADESRPDDVTTFCVACGNNFHKACVNNWIRARGHDSAKCPLCRADMNPAGPGDAPGTSTGTYTNLAQFSSQHQRSLTLAELYANTHQYIGRGGRGGGRGRGR